MSKKKNGEHSQQSSKLPHTNVQNASVDQLIDRLVASVPDDIQIDLPISQTPSKDDVEKTIEESNSQTFNQLKSKLPTFVPENLQLAVQGTPSHDDVKTIIDDANSKAVDILNNAKLTIIKLYAKNESERAERQKPLLWIIVCLTALQLVAFNVIIALIACAAFKTENSEIILQLFEILKYYIGATLVELIGMIWFITRDTFSSNHIKMMKLMFADKLGGEAEKKNTAG